MSRVSALVVLMIYITYFVHEIRARHGNDAVQNMECDTVEAAEEPSVTTQHNHFNIISPQPLHPRTIRFADEDGNVDGNLSRVAATNMANQYGSAADLTDDRTQGVSEAYDRGTSQDGWTPSTRSSFQYPRRFNRFSRSLSRGSSHRFHSRESSLSTDARRLTTVEFLMESRAEMDSFVHDQPVAKGFAGSQGACITMLIVSSLVMSICGELLVSTIDEVTRDSGTLSKPFIGLIILPIVGNVAEYVTVVSVGLRGKLDLAIAVAVGSSIQISLCVTPLTVLAGWALHRDLGLSFNVFEMLTLVGSVLLVNLLLLNDGGSTLRTGGLKGALMCACYAIFRSVYFLSFLE